MVKIWTEFDQLLFSEQDRTLKKRSVITISYAWAKLAKETFLAQPNVTNSTGLL